MRIKFYLRNGEATTPTAVFARISYHCKTCKVYLDQSIHPKNWNVNKHQAKFTADFPQATTFNERLNKFVSTVEKLWNDYRNQNDNKYPDPGTFKTMIEKKIKHGEQGISFVQYFENFTERTEAGKRMNKKSGQPVGQGIARAYRVTLNHLTAYQKKNKQTISFDSIDETFYENFTEFLQKRGLSLNTIGANFRRITTVMIAAFKANVSKNQNWKQDYFVKTSEPAIGVYLTKQEIKLIEDLDLRKDPRLDRARDFFLMGCYTGLRYSDLAELDPKKHTSDKYIQMEQKKTSTPVVVKLNDSMRRIFKKYDNAMPRTFYNGHSHAISQQRVNDYIKEVCAMIPELHRPVTKIFTKGKKKIEKVYAKYELVSSHTGRRSFVSNKIKDGFPIASIMQQSGHTSEKMLMLYSKLTPIELADMMEAREKEIERLEKQTVSISVPAKTKKQKTV